MRKLLLASIAITGLAVSATVASAQVVVGVSWNNFQEERWKTDEAAIKAALDAGGAKYISTDAQSSAAKQLTDIENLIAQGANVLIVLAQDTDAIQPAVQKAVDEGIPVIGYDRLIENPKAFYITFDNKQVGVLEAEPVFKLVPKGNYVFIKGNAADPNADFVFSGQMEVVGEALKNGDIKNVGESYTDNWDPTNAQKEMEQFLTVNDNKVDASFPRTTAWPAASSRPWRRKASPDRFRSPARMATMPPSTAWRSGPRPCRCGRTRVNSARRPAKSPCNSRTER
jgi:D-xylose transport system substrate-binding protein